VTWINGSPATQVARLTRRRRASARFPDGSLPHDNRVSRFEDLALPHAATLYRTAYHLAGNAGEAEDLTQEAYLRAFRAFDDYRGGNARAWLLTILRHVFIDECRRRGRMRTVELDAADLGSLLGNGVGGTSSPSAEHEALDRLPSEAIERAVAALPADWRLVLLLADVEELSYREIAEVMDVPLGTVMSRLHRARKRIQERLLDSARAHRNQHEKSA
jgi:RNA polymerase sigma-70 factor (ECF subfamily)